MAGIAIARRSARLAGWGLLACGSGAALGEAVFDGTLGPMGELAGHFEISDAFGTQLGPNLFHSFATFSVNRGESATFTSSFAGVTDNVIGRVTGGNLTTIDGLLASTIPGADLWLINPSGLVIGDHASLDVLGGFHAGTADYLALGDGGRFDATNLVNTQLTIANPTAFGFIDTDIAPIGVGAAALAVLDGEALSLVGGDLELTGSALSAPRGSASLVGVGSAGVVDLGDPASNLANIAAFADLTLSDATVATDGEQGGPIYILGGELKMSAGSITAHTTGSGQGQDIRIDVDNFYLENEPLVETHTFADGHAGSIEINATGTLKTGTNGVTGSGIRSIAWNDATGNAGSITINAADVDHQFSTIGIFTLGTGIGGALTVNAENSIYVEGGFGTTLANNSIAMATAGDVVLTTGSLEFNGGSILARALGDGDGGNLLITADNLMMSNGTQFGVGAFGLGDGGVIDLNVTDTITMTDDIGYPTGIFAGASAGQGGDINLRTRLLNIFEGAQLSDSVFFTGSAGDINVDVEERILISGRESVFTGIFANTFSSGNAGTMTITTPLLELRDGGSLQAATLAEVDGGQGGSIVVNVDDLVIQGEQSFISARSLGPGNGGDINIDATGTVMMVGDPGPGFTSIVASANASGNGGDIVIETGSLSIFDSSVVSATTFGDGSAGSITITAHDGITVNGETKPDPTTGGVPESDTGITGILNDTFGAGHAGSINLSAPSIDISGFGLVRAASAGLGYAGAIGIGTDDLAVTDGGKIAVLTVGAGNAGSLSIDASGTISISGANEEGPSSLSSETQGSGSGGTVAVVADRVVLDDRGLVTAATTADGRGGDVVVEGRWVHVTNDASITAESSGSGNAGTVVIVANQALNVDAGGAIQTNSKSSAGGNIDLEVGHTLFLDDGLISAAAGGVTPDDAGGNVTIDPQFVILRGSSILANANAGNGGNISIRAGSFVVDAGSAIDASSNAGLDGEVLIDSPNEITGGVLPLEAPPTDPGALLTQRCAPQLGAERSSLTSSVGSSSAGTPGDFVASPPSDMGAVGARAAADVPEVALARAPAIPSCVEPLDAGP